MRACPECGDPLIEHAPFDPDLVRRGLFRSAWVVLACTICGHVERVLPQPRIAQVTTPATGRRVRWNTFVASAALSA